MLSGTSHAREVGQAVCCMCWRCDLKSSDQGEDGQLEGTRTRAQVAGPSGPRAEGMRHHTQLALRVLFLFVLI